MQQPSDLPHVIDNKAAHSFEAVVDGLVATLTYRRNPQSLVLVHTEVPDALAGRGIGSALLDAAIAAAAEAHLTVLPECPFARQWLQKHPEAARRVVIEWPKGSK